MSRIRHRLLAIVALLLAMFTVTPSAMADMRGIDVSGWQSPTVTCTADYDFAVVKATQGTGFTNGYMTSQARCVQQRGKSLGFYHYAGGGNATAEADYFVNAVRPYLGRAVLVLDWEGYQNAAWGDSNWVRVFVNRVTRGPAYGRSSTRAPPTCTRSRPTCAATADYGSHSTPTTTPPATRHDRGTTGATAKPCASTPATAASTATRARWI